MGIFSNPSREDRVREFVEAAETELSFELVWTCMGEECLELKEAAAAYELALATDDEEIIAKARANLVKEWADVQYVLSQLALFYNIDGQQAFNRVAVNNMTKVKGGVKRREDGKILKPDDYQPADMRGL